MTEDGRSVFATLPILVAVVVERIGRAAQRPLLQHDAPRPMLRVLFLLFALGIVRRQERGQLVDVELVRTGAEGRSLQPHARQRRVRRRTLQRIRHAIVHHRRRDRLREHRAWRRRLRPVRVEAGRASDGRDRLRGAVLERQGEDARSTSTRGALVHRSSVYGGRRNGRRMRRHLYPLGGCRRNRWVLHLGAKGGYTSTEDSLRERPDGILVGRSLGTWGGRRRRKGRRDRGERRRRREGGVRFGRDGRGGGNGRSCGHGQRPDRLGRRGHRGGSHAIACARVDRLGRADRLPGWRRRCRDHGQ